MEVSNGIILASIVYISLSGSILLVLVVLALPTLVIVRRKSQYFDDWNSALKAPWCFWHVGGLLFRIQELLGNYVVPAPQRVCDLAYSHFRSQVLIVVNELGVPDLLRANGPMTGEQLAAATGARREYLERVLRAASRMGVISMSHDARESQGVCGARRRRLGRFDLGGAVYGLTQLSAVLCEGHPNSVKAMVSLFGDHYHPAGHLLEGVRGGVTPYEVYSGGKSHWHHMAEVPELRDRFDRAMTQFNNLSPIEAVFMAYPEMSSFTRLVDVGGGLGAFVGAALSRHPGIRGALFDMPDVIKQAEVAWAGDAARRAARGRVEFTGGSFFDAGSVPRAAGDKELYVLREILHDWSDADSLKILREVRSAIGRSPGCRLLLVEAVISNSMSTSASARINGDVHMLVQYGDAKERTEDQFDHLLAAAGFRLERVVPTKGLFLVVEATPA